MRLLSQSSSNKSTQVLLNTLMSKIIKTIPLLKQHREAQTGMNDSNSENASDILQELVSKISQDIEKASDL